jgi:hypothetical protein
MNSGKNVIRRLEPSDLAKSQPPHLRLNKVHPSVLAEIFSDRTTPLLANPPVWKGWWFTLSEQVENHVFAKNCGSAAMRCHLCGYRKRSVRSRKTITIGLHGGTVRWQFCEECAVIVEEQSQRKDEEDKNRQRQ